MAYLSAILMAMEMIEVEAFVAISQAGSVSRAAANLNLSQPAMSRRINLLEQELGVRLFDRIPNGVRLSEAGEAFLPYARQVLAAARDGVEAVQAHEREPRGPITLALVGTLASSGLTERLRVFRDEWPAVRLLIKTARSDEVTAMVQRGEARLGLRYFTGSQQGIIALPLAEEPLRVVSAADSRLVTPGISTSSLGEVPWIGFPRNSVSSGEPFALAVERQLVAAGFGDLDWIAIDSLTAQKRLIEADFGVGLLPVSSVEEEIRLRTLRAVPAPALEMSIPIVAIHRRDGYLSAAARELLAALTDNQPG